MHEPQATQPFWQDTIIFALMVSNLVFVNWVKTQQTTSLWRIIFSGLLGFVFALPFGPESAALYFLLLIPLAAA